MKLRGLLIPGLLVGLWAYYGGRPEVAYYLVSLPDLGATARDLVKGGELPLNLAASLSRALLALVTGGIAGLIVGIAMASSRTVDRLLGSTLHGLRQVPLLGLAPLIGLWFGNGDAAKALIVNMAVFFPVVLNTHEGVRAIDRGLWEIAHVYGMTRLGRLRRVLLPGVAPALFTGLSQAVAFAWISTIGSELLFAAGAGMGSLMENAQAGARMDIVLVCVLVVGTVGVSVNALVRRLGDALMRWRDDRVTS
jgi:sulfonate transport system permease protein